jgi:hypothetical protein
MLGRIVEFRRVVVDTSCAREPEKIVVTLDREPKDYIDDHNREYETWDALAVIQAI